MFFANCYYFGTKGEHTSTERTHLPNAQHRHFYCYYCCMSFAKNVGKRERKTRSQHFDPLCESFFGSALLGATKFSPFMGDCCSPSGFVYWDIKRPGLRVCCGPVLLCLRSPKERRARKAQALFLSRLGGGFCCRRSWRKDTWYNLFFCLM